MRKLQQNTKHLWLSTSLRGTLTNFPLKKQLRRVTVPGIYPISHHPVTNPNKPGKLRIVFDAAAEFAETSLNKNLQGPNMTNSRVGAWVLLCFSQGRFELAANVEAMFHQVRVRKEDQDGLPFLWWSDNYTKPPDVYVMKEHIFGAASSPCVTNSVLRRTASDYAKGFSNCRKGFLCWRRLTVIQWWRLCNQGSI